MSVLDRFLPPPGAPGAIRDGVAAWRSAADRVEQVARELRGLTATASAGWHGSASDAFSTTSMSFLGQVAQAAGLLHRSGDLLDAWADRVEEAQTEYHRRIGLVVGTGVVFGAFTLVTAGASDVAGSAAVGMELAAVTEGADGGRGPARF